MSATTHELTIERAQLRMRLHESQLGWQSAIERVHERVVKEALELALASERRGDELICVRSVAISLRLDPRGSEGAWMQLWTTSLAQQLTELLRAADPRRVVRYPSPSAALVDMGRSLARGDLRRSWAWAQLGFIAASVAAFDERSAAAERPGQLEPASSTNLARACEGFTRALLIRPELIVGVLAQLGRAPQLLLRLLERLGAPRSTKLAAAALRVHGLAPRTASLAPERRVVEREIRPPDRSAPAELRDEDTRAPRGSTPSDQAVHELLELSSRSVLAEALRELVGAAPRDAAASQTSRALLVLAVLDAAPMLARRLLLEHDTALELALARLTSTHTPAATRPYPRAPARERALTSDPQQHPGEPHARPEHRSPARPNPSAKRPPPERPSFEPHATPEAHATPEPPVPRREQLAAWRDELIDLRAHAQSEWGGLLFTVPLLRRAQLWARLDELAERLGLDFRAVLHAFGVILVPAPIEPSDPALLAFVGLPPDAAPPLLELGIEATPTFNQELGRVRAELLDALEQCLPARPHRPQRGAALLAWLLRRRAHVFGERGWLELRFALRDVDTDIRRAGLDLNPDWVPELGAVLRFIYE